MKLEIKNLQSQATYEIDPDGAVLGREGSKADIVLRDQAVSKKHAKIYEKNGRWYLEDLASSNGTFVDNRRITEPVILTPGAVFALSENQFEVVQVINGANGKAAAAFDQEGDSRDAPYKGSDGLEDLPPLGMMSGEDAQEGKRSSRSMKSNQSARVSSPAQAGADPADDMPEPEAGQKGVGYFFIAVPKAIAYYMAAIPLMLVNPVGAIRKSVNEQKFPAMGWMQLAAYGIPPMVFQNALATLVAFIVTLIHGSFGAAILTLMPGLPIAIGIAIVSALISGLIWHPVMRWIINFLKGESTDKSRTNYFIAFMCAMALTAVPSALAGLIGLIPLPLVGLVPVVIAAAASAINLFLNYNWLKHFNVVGWFQKVVLILGLLGIVGTLASGLLAQIALLGSGGSAAMAAAAGANGAAAINDANLTAEQKELLKQSQEAAAKALAASGGDADAIKKMQEKALADAQALAAKAQEDAAKAGQLTAEQQEAIKKQQEAAKEAIERAEKQGAAAAAAAQKAAEDAQKAAAQTGGNGKKAAAEEDDDDDDDNGGGGGSNGAAAAAGGSVAAGSTAFQDFLTKRNAVETAIEKDPTILRRKDVLKSYEAYLKKTFEVRGKWAKKKAKDPATQKINDRLKDIEVFDSTSKMVADLYGKIFQ